MVDEKNFENSVFLILRVPSHLRRVQTPSSGLRGRLKTVQTRHLIRIQVQDLSVRYSNRMLCLSLVPEQLLQDPIF